MSIRKTIRDLILNIAPFDTLEQNHINEALSWIDSGIEIFRAQKPDVPNKHIVTYFVVFDESSKKNTVV